MKKIILFFICLAALLHAETPIVVADPKFGANGTALKLWDTDGHRLARTVSIPQDGAYLLQFKTCCSIVEGVNRIVKVDGTTALPSFFPTRAAGATMERTISRNFIPQTIKSLCFLISRKANTSSKSSMTKASG